MNIAIFKLTKAGNVKLIYENNHPEDITELFGENFRNNNVDTVRRKIGQFIKVNLGE